MRETYEGVKMQRESVAVINQRQEYLKEYRQKLVDSKEFPEWVIDCMVDWMQDTLISTRKVRP
jgi:hypothetical protein